MSKQPISAATGHRMAMLVILLVAFGLRCGGLDWQEFRGDEAFGYFFSLPSLDAIVGQTVDLGEPHPVASYWLQHLWLGVAGHSEFALRFVGVWWSVLAVALTMPLAMQLLLPTVSGVAAAALMALSPYAIWHAQDARMYSMSLTLTMSSTLLALSWWRGGRRSSQLWHTLGYLLVTWLALHTHYFALYVVVAQQLAIGGWAIVEGAWRKLAIWWGMGALLLLMWLPWLMAAWSILLGYGGNGDSPGLVDALLRAHSAFGVGESVPRELQVWWAALTLLAIGLGVITLWRMPKHPQRATLWFLLVYWLTPLAATWLSSQSRPIFNERYLVAAVPPVYLLIAATLSRHQAKEGARWSIWLRRGVVGLVVVGMALGFVRQVSDPLYSKTRGWRELAAALEPLAAGVDPKRVRFVQNYPDPTLWYYYQGDVPHLVLPPAPHDPEGADEEVERLVAEQVERVVLVEQPADSWDADGIARDALLAEFSLAATTTVARWPLSLWLRPAAELEPISVAYAGGLQLSAALITPTELPPGGIVGVHLRWQGGEGSVGEQEAMSLQLINGGGELVAQNDRPLAVASVPASVSTIAAEQAASTIEAEQAVSAIGAEQTGVASYAILLPKTLAGGEYSLAVVIYDPSQEGAPRRLTLQGADSVMLGMITVLTP